MPADGLGRVWARCGVAPCVALENPEPEIVLAADQVGRVKGATPGDDVNLRDVEGCPTLLLGKPKDNNASCAVGLRCGTLTTATLTIMCGRGEDPAGRSRA
jgi:fumarylacetoacetate (FAA) hydrolase family protein